jgi:hypothetical protein
MDQCHTVITHDSASGLSDPNLGRAVIAILRMTIDPQRRVMCHAGRRSGVDGGASGGSGSAGSGSVGGGSGGTGSGSGFGHGSSRASNRQHSWQQREAACSRWSTFFPIHPHAGGRLRRSSCSRIVPHHALSLLSVASDFRGRTSLVGSELGKWGRAVPVCPCRRRLSAEHPDPDCVVRSAHSSCTFRRTLADAKGDSRDRARSILLLWP